MMLMTGSNAADPCDMSAAANICNGAIVHTASNISCTLKAGAAESVYMGITVTCQGE